MVNNDTSHLTAKHLVASGRLTEKQFIFFTICKEEKASQRAKIQKQQKHRERERERERERRRNVLGCIGFKKTRGTRVQLHSGHTLHPRRVRHRYGYHVAAPVLSWEKVSSWWDLIILKDPLVIELLIS